MKKLTIGVLAMLACFTCFVSCSDKKNPETSDPEISSGDELTNTLDEAADYLEDMYKTSNKETRKDYEVVSEVLGFEVTWSADNDAVSIEQGEGETKTKIVINKTLKEDTQYVLKATIKDEEGNTKEVTFERTALKALDKVPQAITSAPVEGVAYKYYVYQSTKELDLYFAGEMDKYYFKTTELLEEAVDLYVEYVDDTNFNVYFNHAEDGKQYIGVRLSDDGQHDNIVYDATPPSSFVWNAELGTITTHLDVNKNGAAADYYLGNYSTHTTISASMLSYAGGSGNNVGQLMEMVEKAELSDADKIAAVKDVITVQDTHKVDKEIELVASNDLYAEVSIAWSIEGTGAVLTGNKLALTIPETASTVTLTATFTCGETTDTKVFTLTLGPAIATPTTAEEIVDAAYSLATNETLPGTYTLTGVITKVNTVYSEQYSNVTVTIAVEGKEDNVIECFRMKGDGADIIKVGDTITVTGSLANYNGTVEFNSGCTLDSYVVSEGSDDTTGGDTVVIPDPDTEVTIEQAIAIGNTFTQNNYTDGKYYVTGTVKEAVALEYTYYYTTTIEDSNGNTLYIFGLLNGDGVLKYNEMTTQLNVGDTVKLYGPIGYYSSAQMKNANIVEINGSSTIPTDADKLAYEKSKLTISESFSGETTVGLSANGTAYNAVSITWEITLDESNIASIADGKLKLSNPSAEATVTVVATLTCGEETDSKSFNIVVKPSAGESWKMVTNVSQLTAGSKIVIAALESDVAIGDTQNTNNRAQSTITKADGSISFDDSVVEVLTLCEGNQDGTFAFQVEEGGYLYAASSSSNWLRTEDTLSDNSSWSISIASDGTATVVAQGTNTHGTLQYNKSSSLFSAYTSATQKAICIYIYA